ncbi:kinase-like domain-containing protein [Rhizophagus irregularis DAOM 181602=DAOM 197198]|nr:kinase-like domain-containing protein [Rhizophagus irregularis DAOM 181602=DAOM 197198]
MYEDEEEIVKNINEAIYWYKKSAEQGNQNAHNKLEELKNREIENNSCKIN